MKPKQNLSLLCGMLGCLCFGGGDWLMMYGNTAHSGAVSWLTERTASISQWRYDLAMALAFPGIILYGIALFSVQSYIRNEKDRKIYQYLNAFGLTPWIALHLFCIMLLPHGMAQIFHLSVPISPLSKQGNISDIRRSLIRSQECGSPITMPIRIMKRCKKHRCKWSRPAQGFCSLQGKWMKRGMRNTPSK